MEQASPRSLRTFHFDNSYSRDLPEEFYQQIRPTPVRAPRLIRLNKSLAAEFGVELTDAEAVGIFSGNVPLEGSNPIALVYAGHQFGHFVPRLGDGRAILLGEAIDLRGRRWDVQLKGSGQTRYSRMGDGRAALGPVLREFIVSEGMHALGIKTTRALAAVITGEWVEREGGLLPGAVLTRIASSHLRIGTFEYFSARGDIENLRRLSDYAIRRHYPHLASGDADSYLAFLETVADAQAALVASWMAVGFIHGVMNTDNMTISGETIDYGPCAFMDTFNPLQVYSAIDRYGRYAYANQPNVAQWNLACLAEALLPILHPQPNQAIARAQEVIDSFRTRYESHWLSGMRRKLGLRGSKEDDKKLAEDWLGILHKENLDFTRAFLALTEIVRCAVAKDRNGPDGGASELPVSGRLLRLPPSASDWLKRWETRRKSGDLAGSDAGDRDTVDAANSFALQAMKGANPIYIPRNHLVEQALAAAVQSESKNQELNRSASGKGNESEGYTKMTELMSVLAKPYEEQKGTERFALGPEPHERIDRTFCGT